MGTKMKRKGSNMIKWLVSAAILSVAMLNQTAAVAQQSVKPPSYKVPVLKIGYGDLIAVSMFDAPDLSGQFRVDANGDINLPLLGHVHVVGLTADEAGALIAKRYVDADILKPQSSYATVSIAEYATQGITVTGAVRSPGVYPALGIRMLNDVIAAAGGTQPDAASKVIITHRDDPSDPVTVDYNPEALTPKIPQVQILPGDTLLVPRAGIVYVLGDVIRSGGYVLDGRQTMSIEEAMALAGGGGKAAALKRVQLVRTLKDGRKEAITVSVKKIFEGKAPDLALKDGDVVYVPTSTGKLAAEQAITSALGIGTQVVIYRTVR